MTDDYSIDEDDTLAVSAATGVLDNDTDAENDPLTASLVSPPANGTVSLAPDGSITYMPDENYHGPDSFTYQANDGTRDSAPTPFGKDAHHVNPDHALVLEEEAGTSRRTSAGGGWASCTKVWQRVCWGWGGAGFGGIGWTVRVAILESISTLTVNSGDSISTLLGRT